MKVAVTTEDFRGLEDAVSGSFGKSPTITIVDVDPKEKAFRLVEIFENEASRFSSGSGPVLIYILMKRNVEAIISSEIGIGMDELLRAAKIDYMKSSPGTKVREAVEALIQSFKSIH